MYPFCLWKWIINCFLYSDNFLTIFNKISTNWCNLNLGSESINHHQSSTLPRSNIFLTFSHPTMSKDIVHLEKISIIRVFIWFSGSGEPDISITATFPIDLCVNSCRDLGLNLQTGVESLLLHIFSWSFFCFFPLDL